MRYHTNRFIKYFLNISAVTNAIVIVFNIVLHLTANIIIAIVLNIYANITNTILGKFALLIPDSKITVDSRIYVSKYT